MSWEDEKPVNIMHFMIDMKNPTAPWKRIDKPTAYTSCEDLTNFRLLMRMAIARLVEQGTLKVKGDPMHDFSTEIIGVLNTKGGYTEAELLVDGFGVCGKKDCQRVINLINDQADRKSMTEHCNRFVNGD